MKKHPISLLLWAALSLGAATLSAQSPGSGPAGSPPPGAPPPPPPGHHGPPPSPLFRALDANGDGTLSADEIANAPAALKTLAGESGQITRDSLRPPRREGGGDRHPNDDAPRPHRPRPDAQRDDPDAGPVPRPQRPPPPPPDAEHGPRKADASPAPEVSSAAGNDSAHDPAGPRRHGPPHGDRLFDALDANGDGTLSADELAAASAALRKADTNGDGVIDHRDFRPPPPPPPAPAE